jgi:hypothetical protein
MRSPPPAVSSSIAHDQGISPTEGMHSIPAAPLLECARMAKYRLISPIGLPETSAFAEYWVGR